MAWLPITWLGNKAIDLVKEAVVSEAQEIVEPYKQASNSIPHLFVSASEECSTYEWYRRLSSSPSTYESCRVVSLTWAKALASPLSHEFCQFIVEDTRNGTRTRVFANRLDLNEPDRIIVGRDWAAPKNPSDQKDLPMPMKSLKFDHDRRPTVLQMAQLMKTITEQAPKYTLAKLSWTSLSGNMCWWFAQSVFDASRAAFGGNPIEWEFARYAYTMVIWDGVFTPQSQMEAAARKFKKQNISDMSWQVGSNVKKEQSPTQFMTSVGKTFLNEEAQKQYIEALALDESEKLDMDALNQAINTAVTNAEENTSTTQEFSDAGALFTSTLLTSPDFEANFAAFEAAEERIRAQDGMFYSKPLHYGPGADKKMAWDRAMRAFVGSVLRDMPEEYTTVPEKKEQADEIEVEAEQVAVDGQVDVKVPATVETTEVVEIL